MIKIIGQWIVDYRVDIAYRPLDSAEEDRVAVEVYEKRTGNHTIEYFSEDFVKDLFKSADNRYD